MHGVGAAIALVPSTFDQPARLKGVEDGDRRGAIDPLEGTQAPLRERTFGGKHDQRTELPGVQVVCSEHGVDLRAQPIVRSTEQRSEKIGQANRHRSHHHLW